MILENHGHTKLVIGSSQESRTKCNPWNSIEREEIIKKSIDNIYTPEKISFHHLPDILESDEIWLQELQELA